MEEIQVKCSCCGSDMDCPDFGVKVESHTCSFCTDFLADGIPEDKVKELSLKKRELSKYYPQVKALAKFLFDSSFERIKLTKQRQRELGKRALAEEMYLQGISSALDFLLHTIDPNVLLGLSIFYCPDGGLDFMAEQCRSEGIDIDPKKLEDKFATLDRAKYSQTAEGMARMFNDLIFDGDWKKHIEWIEKYGGDEQKREDIPLLKELMEKGEPGAKKPDC